jgi:hypothetical protein
MRNGVGVGHGLGSVNLPNQYRCLRLINPTDYKCKNNRFFLLNGVAESSRETEGHIAHAANFV